MIILISVCDITWWMAALAMIVPVILTWLLANTIAKEKNESQRNKIKQLQAELKKCYEEKQIIKTKLVSPKVKFSDKSAQLKTGSIRKKLDNSPKSSRKQQGKEAANLTDNSQNTSTNNPKSKYPKLQDNLEIVEGIGPKMREILHENGIQSWSALASKSSKELKAILNKYGDRYRIIDPKTWPLQAELAHQNLWGKLIAVQEKDGGKEGRKGSSKFSKLLIKYGYTKKWKQDDLKAIEGIGPKIASLLNEAGINTWNQLANTSTEDIKSILEKAGKRYALATPDSWPSQAKLAAVGNFSGLEQLQSKLKGGK